MITTPNFPVYNDNQSDIQSPYERAKSVYESEPCARTFMADLQLHLARGYVFNTPRLFLMGRPVRRSGDPRDIVNPLVDFLNPDCWHVYLAAGDMGEFFKFEPFELQWFSWERNNRLRFYNREQVIWRSPLRRSVKKEVLENHQRHLRHQTQSLQPSEPAISTAILHDAGPSDLGTRS